MTGLAVAGPVLDAFGRSPEAFAAREAAPGEVVAFGVIVWIGPPLALLAVEGVVWLAGRGAVWRVHDVVVALGGGVALAHWVRQVTSPGLPVVAAAAVMGAVAVGVLRARVVTARRVVRVMGVTSASYVVAFLVLSPTGVLTRASWGGAEPDRALDAAVASDLVASDVVEGPAPVVVVVFDALPTVSLLDGRGGIDARVAPHMAALTQDATWYQNNTTVSGWTQESLGVLLTGTLPVSPARQALGGGDRRNLFTLLGGSYDVYAHEPATQVCPVRLCPRSPGAALPRLLTDAARLWWHGEGQPVGAGLPGALEGDRLARTERWIDRVPLDTDDNPDLVFLHVLVPHGPFRYLPDGRSYQGSNPATGVDGDRWEPGPAARVGRQRHLLQVEAADALLGRLLDRLRATGTYDDALIVVTADHGIAFTPGEPVRGVTEAQYEQVLWTPLIVKAPRQTNGQAVDAPTRSVDVMATIADLLGVDVPWALDGTPAHRVETGSPRPPVVQDWNGNGLGPPGPGELVPVDGEQGWQRLANDRALAASGPAAVWQAIPSLPLVGRPVDDLGTAGPTAPGPATPLRLAIENLDKFDDVDLDEPLPLELLGEVSGRGHRTIALALNGTIAAMVRIDRPGPADIVALLHPDTFMDGANTLTAHLVDDTGHLVAPINVTPS
jgi:hypothetical protein